MALNQVSITPTTILIDPRSGQATREGFLVFQALIQYAQGVTSASVTTDGVQTLTNKTMSGNSNTFSHIPTAALDNTTGPGGQVVTGNPGMSGDLATWDVNGDLEDGPNPDSFVSKEAVVNDTVATVLGSLGPVGSNTTVQGWIVVRDVNDAILGYTPYF